MCGGVLKEIIKVVEKQGGKIKKYGRGYVLNEDAWAKYHKVKDELDKKTKELNILKKAIKIIETNGNSK